MLKEYAKNVCVYNKHIYTLKYISTLSTFVFLFPR